MLWVLNDLYRACRGLLIGVGPPRLTQTLLVQKTLISRELAKDQVLVSVSLVLLNQKVIGRRHWVMLVIFDLLDDAIEAVKRLKIW